MPAQKARPFAGRHDCSLRALFDEAEASRARASNIPMPRAFSVVDVRAKTSAILPAACVRARSP
jgi:hypothetical protein